MRSRIALQIALVLAAVAMVGGTLSPIRAEMPGDYAITEGHFFTQGDQSSDTPSGIGYGITNSDSMPFWDAYQSYGGVDVLGYPISQRFYWNGQMRQITEKAVLQWDATSQQVHLANIFDDLCYAGKDSWLEKTMRIPVSGAAWSSDGSSEDDDASLALIESAPITRSYYNGSPERKTLFGLPRSKVGEYDVCDTVRFQRTALYVWQKSVEGHERGEITFAPVGQIVRESGLFDSSIFTPEYISPDTRESRKVSFAASSRGERKILSGRATWYGGGFQGSVMRNGNVFNMYDSTTTASNVHPLGSVLRITSTITGLHTDVRVTDTGGFRYPILVDMSWAAFKQIADPNAGTIQVIVERIE